MASASVVGGGARHGGERRRRVLVFPLPFQGHTNPMLQLAGALHGRGGLCVTVLHTRFNALDPSRHPELAFVEVADGIPPDVAARGRVAEIILAMNAAMEATEDESGAASPSNIREVLASVVAAGEGQPSVACLVIDSHLLAVQKAAAGLGIPTLVLRTGSAACLRCYLAYDMLLQKAICLPKHRDELVFEVLARIAETVRNSNGVVISTFEELEPMELERVHGELGDDSVATVLATGPLHRLSSMNTGSNTFNLRQDQSCIE
ncbi:Os07g0241600 [Oryza sativa Japonica Group]|uniref:Uncharacterized protein n=2 Tax=Oryza sativa subsp. japonica TaxID=39947 RepID=A0A8J8XRT0_ORYSJ|nr:hypothetical protein OsJ_23667 [Oryza sativa Japonica Group]BAT00772.1 Os07g0241600 [Oryza sativa Japonica Group]